MPRSTRTAGRLLARPGRPAAGACDGALLLALCRTGAAAWEGLLAFERGAPAATPTAAAAAAGAPAATSPQAAASRCCSKHSICSCSSLFLAWVTGGEQAVQNIMCPRCAACSHINQQRQTNCCTASNSSAAQKSSPQPTCSSTSCWRSRSTASLWRASWARPARRSSASRACHRGRRKQQQRVVGQCTQSAIMHIRTSARRLCAPTQFTHAAAPPQQRPPPWTVWWASSGWRGSASPAPGGRAAWGNAAGG